MIFRPQITRRAAGVYLVEFWPGHTAAAILQASRRAWNLWEKGQVVFTAATFEAVRAQAMAKYTVKV